MAFLIYLILVGVVLFIAIPAGLIFYARYWNGSKFLKAQMAKAPIDTFGGTISKWREYTFKEDEDRYFAKIQGEIWDKLFSPKGMVYVSVGASFLTILIPMLIIMITDGGAHWAFWLIGILLFPLPIVMFYRASYKRYRMIEGEREGQIKRMFDVANSVLKFDPMAAFMPSSVVNVTKWKDKTIPQSVIILYPTNFRADTPSARENFESVFNTAITEDNAWIYTWHPTKNAIQCRPVEDLPKYVEYRGVGPFEWHTFPLGVGLGPKGQEIISYSVNKNKTGIYYPHVLIAGTTGSGKSVIQRNIIFHCIQHNDMWRFLGVDLKRVELSRFKRYTKTVLGIATDLEQGVEVVKYAHDVMMERYAKMEQAGVNIFLDMVDENGKPEYAILLMVDEAFMFMSPEGNKSEEGKRNDALHSEASHILGNIARLGRAAGVHLVLATQRPDATVIKGELKNNLDVRIAAGRLDSTPSLMVLDSGAATLLPPIKGRGVVRIGAETRMFQGFFAEQDWIDNWLAKPQNRWREPDLFKDKSTTSKNPSALEPIDEDDEMDFIDVEMEEREDDDISIVEEDGLDDINIDDLLDTVAKDEIDEPTPTASTPLPPLVPPVSTDSSENISIEDLEEIDDEDEQEDEDELKEAVEHLSDDEEEFNADELEAELEKNFMFDDEIDDLSDSNISEEEIERLLMELANIDEDEFPEDEDDVEPIKVNPAFDDFASDFLEDEETEDEQESTIEEIEESAPVVNEKERVEKVGGFIIASEDEPLTIDKPVMDDAMPIRPLAPKNTSSGIVPQQSQNVPLPKKASLPSRPAAPQRPSDVIKKRPEL